MHISPAEESKIRFIIIITVAACHCVTALLHRHRHHQDNYHDQCNRCKSSPLLMTLPHQIVPTFSFKKETRIHENSVNVLTKQRWSYLLDRYVVSELEQTCTFLAGYQFYSCSHFFNVFVISFQHLPLACQAGSFISPCISSKEPSDASVLYYLLAVIRNWAG